MKVFKYIPLILLLPWLAHAQTSTVIRAERDDTSPVVCAEGGLCTLRLTSGRALFCNARDAAGNEIAVATDTNLTTFFAGEDMAGIAATLELIRSNTANIAQDITGAGGTTLDDITANITTFNNKFPTAAALADNTANPTISKIGSYPHWFDGSTWDRALGNSTDGLLVNLGTNNDVTVTGSLPLPTGAATLAEQQTQTTSLQLLDNVVHSQGAALNQVVVIGMKDLITGTTMVPNAINFGGANYQLTLIPDLDLNFLDYTPTGELYGLVASTDNTKANSRYLKVDTSGRLETLGSVAILQASSDSTPITTATDTIVIAAPGVGLKIRVYYIASSNGGTTTNKISFRDGIAGAKRYPVTLPQYGVFAHQIAPNYWDLTTNTALYINTSAASSVDWHIEYSIN